MIVVKFGGSSLAHAEKIRAAARIVAGHQAREPVICVVSAVAGVTDTLLRVARGESSLDALLAQHKRLLRQVSLPEAQATGAAELAEIGQRVASHLRALHIASCEREDAASAHAREVFSAWGERLATRIFAAALESEGVAADAVDAAPVVTTTPPRPLDALAPGELDAIIHHTRRRLARLLMRRLPVGHVAVLPGYLARTVRGRLTTLGRNGTDCSAALVGAALRARAVTLYSDVRGVYRADPRLAPEATLLPALSYEQALRIARTGASVVHAGCVAALARTRTPLLLRSTTEPERPGTEIGACPAAFREGDVLILTRSARATGANPDPDADWSAVTVLSLAPGNTASQSPWLGEIEPAFRSHASRAPAIHGRGRSTLNWHNASDKEKLAVTAHRALASAPHVMVTLDPENDSVVVRAPSRGVAEVVRALYAAYYQEACCLTFC